MWDGNSWRKSLAALRSTASSPVAGFLAAALLTVGPYTAVARTPYTAPITNDATFDYGLSSFLGSGIYSINGQNVQLYRIPVTVDLRPQPTERTQYYAQFPVTFGFYGFVPTDVLQGDVPKSIDTVSALAGLQSRTLLNGEWHYLQLIAAGYTVAAHNPDKQLGGVQSALERVAPWRKWRVRWRNEALGAVTTGRGSSPGKILRLLEGVEMDRLQSWSVLGRQAAIGAYGVVRWYGGAAPIIANGEALRLEEEAGVTFGTAEPIRVLKIPLPRLSLGYRRTSALNVFFLGFGTPF